MIAMCRALISNPKLLLMDEPSLGLSPIIVNQVAKIITQINQTGVSIILVEQNARMALELAKMAYIIEVGSITMKGDAKNIAQDENVIKAYLGG
jgi:branched-chain amino acid transport system ATP-binding protein